MNTGIVCGHGTEAGRQPFFYNFSDGLPAANGTPPWQTTMAPDLGAAAQYQEGGTARLLVEV